MASRAQPSLSCHPELPPHLTCLCTWAVCPFSPVPPSPTASLPQLSLSLLLDVIYSGNAESDKPRLPRQRQWKRRGEPKGGGPLWAGSSEEREETGLREEWQVHHPFLLAAPGPEASPGSLGHPDPFSDPNQLFRLIPAILWSSLANLREQPGNLEVLKSRWFCCWAIAPSQGSWFRRPPDSQGRREAGKVLYWGPGPHCAGRGHGHCACTWVQRQKNLWGACTHSCFHLALSLLPGSLTLWQGGTGHYCQK